MLCAHALSETARGCSHECSKINFKVRNVFSMVFLPGIDMSHMLLWKKMVRARARDIRNCLNMLVEHKWLYLQKTRSLYLQNCDCEPPPHLLSRVRHPLSVTCKKPLFLGCCPCQWNFPPHLCIYIFTFGICLREIKSVCEHCLNVKHLLLFLCSAEQAVMCD